MLYILILFRSKDELQCELGTIYPEDASFGSRDEGRNSFGIRNYQCCWNSNFMEQTIYIFQVTILHFCLLVVLAKRTHIILKIEVLRHEFGIKMKELLERETIKKENLHWTNSYKARKQARKVLKRILKGDRL